MHEQGRQIGNAWYRIVLDGLRVWRVMRHCPDEGHQEWIRHVVSDPIGRFMFRGDYRYWRSREAAQKWIDDLESKHNEDKAGD